MDKKSRKFLITIFIIQLVFLTFLTIFLIRDSTENWLTVVSLNLLLPVFTTFLLHIFDKYVFEDRTIISEHDGGFGCLEDMKLNHKKPLKMLFTNVDKSFLPVKLVKNLDNFPRVNLLLCHSETLSRARAISLEKDNYHLNGIAKTRTTLEYFRDKKLNNMEIAEIEDGQFPFGIMIANGKWIYYTPLWNHNCSTDGAVEQVCIKVPASSEFGKMILESYDSLLKKSKGCNRVVSGYDLTTVINC